LSTKSQVAVPINYKGIDIGEPLRLDILVEDLIIVELKAVEIMHTVYTAQGLTYLKLTGKAKTLVINFFTDNISKSVVPLVGLTFAKLPVE
jgi:GxxExxY protein